MNEEKGIAKIICQYCEDYIIKVKLDDLEIEKGLERMGDHLHEEHKEEFIDWAVEYCGEDWVRDNILIDEYPDVPTKGQKGELP